MPQVVIYPKEAAQLTGNSYEAGRKLLGRIRAHFGKPSRTYVSVGEFCQYTGLPAHEVAAALTSR